MSKYEAQCEKHREAIATGRLLAIDPASGATSDIGYAIFEKGELIESGSISIPRAKTPKRLRELCRVVYHKFKDQFPDVLVVERIRGSNAHVSLLWAVGTIIAALPCDILLECPVPTWKKHRPWGYEKSDEQDAKCIGQATLILAGMTPTS